MDPRSAHGRRSLSRVLAVVAALALVAGMGVVVRLTLPGLFSGDAAPAAMPAKITKTMSMPQDQSSGARAVDPTSEAKPDISGHVQARELQLGKLARQAEVTNKRLKRLKSSEEDPDAQDPEDPEDAKDAKNQRTAGGAGVAEFTMANLNVLGDSHTRPDGKSPSMASGATRIRRQADLLRARGVDLVSLQEFQRPQVLEFADVAGDFSMYPGVGASALDAENSVAWRKDTFELVKGRTKAYPYFDFNPRNYPEVLLRHKASGVEFWVTSYHNPANTRATGNNEGAKAKALAMQVANAKSVLDGGKPMIIAGDMNDRDHYFCTMVGQTPMHAANGGSVSDGCAPPEPIWIDWILGSRSVSFSGYVRDNTPLGDMSDHPLIYAQATVRG